MQNMAKQKKTGGMAKRCNAVERLAVPSTDCSKRNKEQAIARGNASLTQTIMAETISASDFCPAGLSPSGAGIPASMV